MVWRIIKILSICLLSLIGSLVLLCALMYGSISWSHYTKKKEAIRYQKEVCDTINFINDSIPVSLIGFKENEIKTLKYFRISKGKRHHAATIPLVNSQILGRLNIMVPTQIFKTDTLAITLDDRLYYLSEMSFEARYNYGMTGPVGKCFCEGTGFKKINGKLSSTIPYILNKETGISNFKIH